VFGVDFVAYNGAMSDPSLAVAVRAARNAAAVIEDAARDLVRLPSSSKEHGEIAAAASTEAANAISTTLTTAFPDHAILGPERGPKREGNSTWRWFVDSLDGTANFRHGYPYYAISIALTHGSELTHAVVLDPIRDELFTAIKGRGALLNGVALRVSGCTALDHALVGTVFPGRASPQLPAYLPILNALIARCAGIRRAGACALDLAYVASGRLDAFWEMSLKTWDVAAGALLVSEAGGRVGDFAGGSDCLRRAEVIAAAPGVFNALREAIDTALG
jgi:myo-inositol-1(or 4)-monophosphatase